MSMQKKFSLTIMILCIVEAICYFTPFCLTEDYWEYDWSIVYHGSSTLTSRTGINIFGVDASYGPLLAVLLLGVTLVTAIVYLLDMLDLDMLNISFDMRDMTEELCKAKWIVAIAHTAMMAFFFMHAWGVAEKDTEYYRLEYSVSWLFYIVLLLNVIQLILALLMKFGELPETKVATVNHLNSNNNTPAETPADLLTYKKLLDAGAITQEEFDKKKKEILNL